MSIYCSILADGRMIEVAGEPIEYEFAVVPRIGEKVTIDTDSGVMAFRVDDVKNYAKIKDEEPGILLTISSRE